MFVQFERDQDASVGVMWRDFVTAVGIAVYTNEGTGRSVTVAYLATIFNTTPELVREAIDEHPWLFSEQNDDSARQVVMSDGE